MYQVFYKLSHRFTESFKTRRYMLYVCTGSYFRKHYKHLHMMGEGLVTSLMWGRCGILATSSVKICPNLLKSCYWLWYFCHSKVSFTDNPRFSQVYAQTPTPKNVPAYIYIIYPWNILTKITRILHQAQKNPHGRGLLELADVLWCSYYACVVVVSEV